MTMVGDLPANELRAHLHRIADWIADYRDGLETRPISPRIERGAVRAAFPAGLPAEGMPFETVLDDFERLIVPAIVHWGHPRFLGYFGSTTTAPGIAAEALTAALNVSAMMWQVSPAATELEEVVLEWLRTLLGLPVAFEGRVHDTASVATLHALAAARELAVGHARREGLAGAPRLTVYASDQAHSSIEKAAIVLGLGETSVRHVASDDAFRMRPSALRESIASDRRAGFAPCAVVATVGTTSTAAVDPVAEIGDICASEHLWLHVDAAYGGAMGLLPEGRWAVAGLSHADSLVVNPHKWLFVPLDFSALYTRRPEMVRAVFSLTPAYLEGDAHEHDAMNSSLQLGRRFRALKAWMVWRTFGANGLVARLREHRRLAALFADWVRADAEFDLAAPVTMGVVCFRARSEGAPEVADVLQQRLVEAVNRGGETYVTHTRLRGRVTLRIAVGNILTTEQHLAGAWSAIRTTLAKVRGALADQL